MLTTQVRKEYKNHWEKRVPLTPSDLSALRQQGLPIAIESSENRIFSDQAYRQLNIPVNSSSQQAEFVLGIKEPKVDSIQAGQVHMAFSHTIKGQSYNMPLLQKFIDQKATLIDYETITDSAGKRTIAFGRFAGIAGAVDSLYIAGQKHLLRGKNSALSQIKQTWQYADINTIEQEFSQIKIDASDEPIQVLIVGTGNVGKGCKEVCQWLGLPKIDIQTLLEGNTPSGHWYAVASSRHINRRKDGSAFDMRDFIKHGKAEYESCFDKLLGKFNILLQTPYWISKYPKHLDKSRLKNYKDKLPPVIGDISCDINGSLESTVKVTDIDQPAYSYNVTDETITEGINADDLTVMAIDNLPCELSKDASEHFSSILKNYLPNLIALDLAQPFENCGLIDELAKAVIVYKGKLTPNYQYLQKFLSQ